MFDIGFAELLIIAVVGLLVIGPERLPGAIRTGSAWLNRFRRGFNDIKHEVQQELHNDAVMRELREGGEKLRRETEALKQDFDFSPDSPLNPAALEADEKPGDGKAASEAGNPEALPEREETREEERKEQREEEQDPDATKGGTAP